RSSERAMSLAPAVGIAGAFPCPLQAAADSAPRTLSVRAFSWRGRDGACRPRGLLLLLRCGVVAPAAVLGDLALAFAQERLAEHAEHDAAVLQHHLADRQARGLVLQDAGQALEWHAPHLERHAGAGARRAQHGRMPVADRPDAIAPIGAVLAHEGRAGREHVGVELEA